MTALSLAEIIEEGKRIEEARAAEMPGAAKAVVLRQRDRFARELLPRLLAVAEAAVEMREAEEQGPAERIAHCRAVFDAAARGAL